MPEIVVIAAIAAKNRVIGKDGELPWYIPDDLKRFKLLTMGHPVVMGRKTFDSIIARINKPLQQRPNYVLTNSMQYPGYPEVYTFGSFPEAIEAGRDANRIFVIGGASVYEEALQRADRLELTIVEGDYEGDAFFPHYETLIAEDFKLVNEECFPDFRFVTYEKKQRG